MFSYEAGVKVEIRKSARQNEGFLVDWVPVSQKYASRFDKIRREIVNSPRALCMSQCILSKFIKKLVYSTSLVSKSASKLINIYPEETTDSPITPSRAIRIPLTGTVKTPGYLWAATTSRHGRVGVRRCSQGSHGRFYMRGFFGRSVKSPNYWSINMPFFLSFPRCSAPRRSFWSLLLGGLQVIAYADI